MEMIYLKVPWVKLHGFQRVQLLGGNGEWSTWASLQLGDVLDQIGLTIKCDDKYGLSANSSSSNVRFHDYPIAHKTRKKSTPVPRVLLTDLVEFAEYRARLRYMTELQRFIKGEIPEPVIPPFVANDEYGNTGFLIPVEYIRIHHVNRYMDDERRFECSVRIGHHITVFRECIVKDADGKHRLDSCQILDPSVLHVIEDLLYKPKSKEYLDGLVHGLPDLERDLLDSIPGCDFEKPPPPVIFFP